MRPLGLVGLIGDVLMMFIIIGLLINPIINLLTYLLVNPFMY
jgi:hypothetical protein